MSISQIRSDWARAASIALMVSLSRCSLVNLDSLNGGVGALVEPKPNDGDAGGMAPADVGEMAPADAGSSVMESGAAIPEDGTPFVGPVPTGDANAPPDGGVCNGTKPFGTPALLTSLVSSSREAGLHLLPDELSGLFWEGPLGATSLFETSRGDRSSPFGEITLLKNVNAGLAQYDPSASGDGLSLVFRVNATGATNGDDLYWSSRANVGNDFSKGTPIAGLNTSFSEVQPFLVPDGSSLYFSSNASGGYDIYRTRGDGNGSFAAPTAVSEVNEAMAVDQNPTLTADDLTMVFSSTRSGGSGGQDIWMTRRPSRESIFAPPINLAEINTGDNEYPSWLSADGCRLYLYSDRSGTLHIYESIRPR